MNGNAEVRPSPIAGTWYSADPQRLTRQVDQYLSEARVPEISGEVMAVITPHAGYGYSGRTAGHAFAPVIQLILQGKGKVRHDLNRIVEAPPGRALRQQRQVSQDI